MPAGRLLRRHVAGTAHDDTGVRELAILLGDLGKPKVRDARLVRRVDEHVLRLQVALQSATLVREVDGLGNDLDVARRGAWRQRAFLYNRSEIPARDIVHREIVLTILLADLVDGD